MKVLIADKFEEVGIKQLKEMGCDITFEPGLEGTSLRDAVVRTGCAVLIVRGTKVPADVIEAGNDLSLIIRAGAGYNTIDVKAASRRGVAVANCPGKNAVAVAELAMGLILALDRRIVENSLDLRQGKWNKKEYSVASGLERRVLGVIGVGEIGRAVIQRALAFDMTVVAWSRSLTDEAAESLGVQRCATPAEVTERCDILTIHLAAAPDTKNIVNADVLNRLKAGSCLINTARAEVLDYAALAKIVKEKKIRVGLDVFPEEPSGGTADFRAAILDAGGIIYGTHHIGASTDQAQLAIADETVRIAKVYQSTGQVINCVNYQTQSPACYQLIVRHYDRVGVLASVLDKISRAEISVKEMSNTMFEGNEAAVAVICLDKEPRDDLVAALAAMKDKVIKVDVKPIGV